MATNLIRWSKIPGHGGVLRTHQGRKTRFLCTMAVTSILSTQLTEAFSVLSVAQPLQFNARNKFQISSRRWMSVQSSSAMTPDEKEMTDDALAIIREAIHAVDPQTAVKNYVEADSGSLKVGSSLIYNDQDYDETIIVAFGKASSAMAKATAERVKNAFPDLPMSGIVIVKDDHATKDELELLADCNVIVREASHPIPDERSFGAAKEIMKKVSSARERSLVICCISGGGSSLFCHPKSELTLDDLQSSNGCFLGSGMTIQEINILRKRLEDGKGGRLAAVAYPATCVSLVLSDILGDPLDLIASGPTVPDPSTWKDAWHLVQKYDLENGDFALPRKVLNMLKQGVGGDLEDTPSKEHPAFSTSGKCETVLVGNNELAVLAAANESKRRGYNPVVLGTMIEGEARHAAGMYTAMAQHLALQRSKNDVPFAMAPLPVALIGGGETIVTLSGSHGKGGRNQELALAAALQFQSLRLRNVVLASAGTDGTDGPTDAAGAVVDGGTVDRIPLSAEEYLRNHDAYSYFEGKNEEGTSPLIMTGPTGTNVADVCVTLVR